MSLEGCQCIMRDLPAPTRAEGGGPIDLGYRGACALARRAWGRRLMLACLLVSAAAMTGCALAGWVAHAVHDPTVPEPLPEYQGLLGKSIAVVVAADDTALTGNPDAPYRICQYVTQRLATQVTGVRAMAPAEVLRYQKANPDWIATPYGEVARDMKVERLVVISLAEYRTHEFGNREVWQGILSARVGVIEADAGDSSNFKYLKSVAVQFPPDKPMGVLDASEEKIEHGMLSLFAGKVAGLFREMPKQ